MSGGRVRLGVALGYRDVEFDGFDLARPERARRMDEQLEVLTRALREPQVSYKGDHYAYDGAGLTPPPVQRPIPIWVGATSAAATARAARFGLPVMFGSTLPRDAVARLVEHYRAVAAEHGTDPNPGFTQSATMWVAETHEAAQEIVPRVRYLLREQLGGWRYLKNAAGELVGFDRPEELDRAVAQALDVCIVGDPDEASERVADLIAAGLTEFVARIKFDGVDRDAFLRCYRLLAREVLPRFR
jgi:alkanesulfonate monooxygenase SsuD/methylene tetrahydromethanopterin reductase-like flavin-dependent oxidoreductase (luciferase family)